MRHKPITEFDKDVWVECMAIEDEGGETERANIMKE